MFSGLRRLTSPAISAGSDVSESDLSTHSRDSGSSPASDFMDRDRTSQSTLSTAHTQSSRMHSMTTMPGSIELADRSTETASCDESPIGFGKRNLLDLMDDLRSFGLSNDVSLSQIVFVGAQSTGKSSLVEGISNIKTPRASGTCTRCPTEFRLVHTANSPWRCLVSLRIAYDPDGNDTGEAKAIRFGEDILDPLEVEMRIRKAQLAILNPLKSPEDFLYGSPETPPALSFSRNFITVEIYGPNIPDLTFCDLPGWIASARDGNENDVKLVNDLLESYIKKPNCLILLTVACETDFETQGAFNLAKKFDPDGERTIGVLTKPDRIVSGDEERWIRFVKNEDIVLDRGWFCVKQPDPVQLQRGLSGPQARIDEERWFKETCPWNQLPREYRSNLGTLKLADYMSDRLATLIAINLPTIKEELQNALDQTKNELKSLPRPLSGEASAEMWKIITAFCHELTLQVKGKPSDDKGLVQLIKRKRAEFKAAIMSLAPRVDPYDTKEKGSYSQSNANAISINAFERELDKRIQSKHSLTLHLDKVMSLIESSQTRELPGFYSYAVVENLIEESKERWQSEVIVYFDEVQVITQEHFRKLIESHFKHYQTGGLCSLVQMEMQEELRRLRDVTRSHLDWLLDVDGSQPLTTDDEAFTAIRTELLTQYKNTHYATTNSDTLVHDFVAPRISNPIGEAIVALNKTSLRDVNVKEADLPKLLPEDGYFPALNVMANVCAYYQVSSKRLIDNVSAAVDYDYVMGLERRVQETLMACIFKDNPRARCARFLQEAPETNARRTNLTKKLERLEAAKNRLRNFRVTD